MTLVTDTWTDPGADGTLVPDTGSMTTKPITCFLDEEGRTTFEVVDSFDPGWALDGPMPYKVTRNLGSGRRVYAVIITGTETHLRDLEPIEDVDVAPYPVPGDKGDQGEVAVHSTVTGSPGSPALVEDLDPSIHKALLKFTIPEGVKGDQGEVEVGTTTTLDAGSAATVTDSDPSPNRAVLEFGIPQGTLVEVDSTATGDAGTPAVVEDVDPSPNRAALKFTIPQGTEVQVGTTTTGAPGTQASVTDRDPSPNRTILDFTFPRGDKGDQGEVAVDSTVTGDAGTAASVEDLDPSPHKALLKFTIPQGTEVQVGTTTTGSAGTPASVTDTDPSPNRTVLDFVVPQGIKGDPGDLTKPVADNLYESKSELLREAVWWVDAGAATATQLEDLTGRGRPAVFGAGAAAPVVLPWSGEDYVAVPGAGGSANRVWAGPGIVAPLGGWCELTFSVKDTAEVFLLDAGGSSSPGWFNWYTVGGTIYARIGTAATQSWVGAITAGVRTVLRMAVSADGLAVTPTVNGVALATKTLNAAFVPSAGTSVTLPRYNAASAPSIAYVYGLQTSNAAFTFDPRNVSADYSTIANTGSAGGDWTITRAATGYKTAVVDRPLLLFGGGQTLTASGSVAGGGTRLRSRRAFGSGGTIGTVETVHATGAPAVSGITEEYLAEAVFSRVLTAAEIAQVSQELAGVPHSQQNAPHLTHPPLIAGTTAAALPTTAREGSIVVLADNTIAIRTRTGGWRALTTTALAGSPP